MAQVEPRTSIWEALAGQAPGKPLGPVDADLWQQVTDRLNPAKARPRRRDGVEEAHLESLRHGPYVMLRSPDEAAGYVRLTPDEAELARRMDGSRTVAALVGEFARISGRLAPDQVLRVVADLAGNRMLEELPVDAFGPLRTVRRGPWPVRLGRWLLAATRGRRFVLGDPDRAVTVLHRIVGGRLFTRAALAGAAVVALIGFVAFVATWVGGATSAFLVGGSYAWGGLTLLGLNVVGLACHELGHALAAKHAGRRVPAAGMLVYFGIPSVFVDTTDVWMAGRRARMRTSAAGPIAVLTFAGTVNVVALAVPALAPVAFKLSFIWYLNALFNLNPLMALDGYYLLMDWLEIPNLRARGLARFAERLRERRLGWRDLTGEDRLVAMYGVGAGLWVVIGLLLVVRIWRDRVAGLVAGLWHAGWASRVGLLLVVALLAAPLVYAAAGAVDRRVRRARRVRAQRDRDADEPVRLAALRTTRFGALPADALHALARDAEWLAVRAGDEVLPAGRPVTHAVVVVDGSLEGRRPDVDGVPAARVGPGEVAALGPALTGAPCSLSWRAVGTRLLGVPRPTVARVLAPHVGSPPPERTEAEAVLALPPFVGLSEAERTAALAGMGAVDLRPGQSLTATVGEHVVVVAAGSLVTTGGRELHRGELVTPDEGSETRATARTVARVWAVPVVPGLTAVLAPAVGPRPHAPTGVHGDPGRHPPVEPPRDGGSATAAEVDRRLGRRFAWLLALLLLLAVLTGSVAFAPGLGWAEIPDGTALLETRRAAVEIVRGDGVLSLGARARIAVRAGDRIRVGPGPSPALLNFAGGGRVELCPHADVTLRHAAHPDTPPGVPVTAQRERSEPTGGLALDDGRIVARTASTAPAFAALRLSIHDHGGRPAPRRTVETSGEAVLLVGSGATAVTEGTVRVDGRLVDPVDRPLDCGTPVHAHGAVVDHTDGHPVSGDHDALTGEPRRPVAVARRGAQTPPSPDDGARQTLGPDEAATPTGGTAPEPTVTQTASPTPSPTPTPTPSPTVPPDIALDCEGDLRGAPGRVTDAARCTVTLTSGTRDEVTLSCLDLPGSTRCWWENEQPSMTVVLDHTEPSRTVDLRVAIDREARPGTYRFTVRAAGTAVTRDTPMTLTVE